MSGARVFLLTLLAMLAFAGNSLLCRLALERTGIDAASFTSVRIVCGAFVLWAILRLRGGAAARLSGNWSSALALFAYAACFSFAYLTLPAGTGALLLFGAVQATMIGFGLWNGERLRARQVAGLVVALGGLVALVLPGLSAPPLAGSVLMLAAGIAWGIYSLRGKGAGDPASATAGNFLRAVLFTVLLSAAMLPRLSLDGAGIWYAALSGGLTSGVGYAIWYAALRGLTPASAASVQLSVPVLAAIGGVLFLGEAVTARLVIASMAILGGVALVIAGKRNA